jgi:tol-pal system protein YbgF
MKRFYLLCLSGLLLVGGVAESVLAQQDLSRLSTRERLERLERLVDTQSQVDLLVRLESLQQELQQLRGESEVQGHALEELKNRQRELYIDIDRRLMQLERGETAAPATPPATPPAATVDSRPATPDRSPRPSTARPTAQPTPTSPGAPGAQSEQQAYQAAFDLLRELRYDKASEAFRVFLRDYPNGRYAHIAQYWMGEANYAQRKFNEAIGDYQQLIANYPDSPKVAEAMLKIGYCHNELQDYDAARRILEQLVADYPGTTEAGQAQNLLQRIRVRQSN